MEGVVLDPEQTDAVGLLAVVVGQDTEPDPDRVGKWRIARGVSLYTCLCEVGFLLLWLV